MRTSLSSRWPNDPRLRWDIRPTAAVLRKAIDNLFSYEAGNYLLDGIAETAQGLAKRTMWRSTLAVLTGLGPEMSYRQYTEVLRFFRESGASLHVLQTWHGDRRVRGVKSC